MKNTVRKITTVLLVLMLTAGLLASAMADTVYMTEGFVIPAERIGGDRIEVQPPEEPEETPPKATPDGGTDTDDEIQVAPEALDKNAEGLVVVDGEKKQEDNNAQKQTEERTNDAENVSKTENENNDDQKITDKSRTEESLNPEMDEEEKLIQIRSKPNGISDILIEIPASGEIDIIDRTGDWICVEYKEVTGYVYYKQMPDYDSAYDQNPETSMKVLIFSSKKVGANIGETIHLTSELQGFDNYSVVYYWQWDRGNGFEDIPGANDPDYYFVVSPETLSYRWRLSVEYFEIEE